MSVYSRDSLEASTHAKATIATDDIHSIHSLTGSFHSHHVSLNLSDLMNDQQQTQHSSEKNQLGHYPSSISIQSIPHEITLNRSQLLNNNVQFADSYPGPFNNNKNNINNNKNQRTANVHRTQQTFFSNDSFSIEQKQQYDYHSNNQEEEAMSPSKQLIESANNSIRSHRSLDLNSFNKQFSFAEFHSSEKMDYKKELTKLLAKSKGTAYESSLKRFVEKKLREINRDQEEHPASLVSQRDEMNSEDEREGKLTLMSLSSSKYDQKKQKNDRNTNRSPSPHGHGRSSPVPPPHSSSDYYYSQLGEREVSRSRLEEMAKPLERNKYKVSNPNPNPNPSPI
jgi:hypothetical protein